VFNTPSWTVLVNLTGQGATAWDNLAQQQFHAYIAIDLDGQVQSAPLTQPSQAAFSSFQGKVQISGSFTQTTAQNLALVLNYGALPVRLLQVNKQQVSPTLGKSSLKAGLAAGIGGLILVLLYTIFYYRALGIVVVSGLGLSAGLLWAIISALGRSSLNLTLDLAGVTGIIVSIGITVDSYIVYFERLKDEARAGRSVRTSVDKSFRGAFRTVLAADLVSLAAAVVLYLLSVGTVKGFAFFLGLSTLLDLAMTLAFTRPLVILLGRSRAVTEARIIGIARGLAAERGLSA
jgi:preprotein translocase subunit SecD